MVQGIPNLLRRLKIKLGLDIFNSSMVKQVSEKLNHLSDEIEKEFSKAIIIKGSRKKIASSAYESALKSMERKMSVIDEASLMKLSTMDQTGDIKRTAETLKLAYENNEDSISQIQIVGIQPADFGILIKVNDRHGADLSFFLIPYGNRMKMVPENFKDLALWESIVSNAGSIANVLNIWSCGERENQAARAIGVTEPEVRIYSGPGIVSHRKVAAEKRTYIESPMLQNITHQQPMTNNFVEISANEIIPQDPEWLKSATERELKTAFKKIKAIKNSLGKNQFTETRKWATLQQQRIKEALKKRSNREELKKLAYKKMQELKKIIAKLKK